MNDSTPPLVLTVNTRLARWLLFEHDRQQHISGKQVWNTPDILPYTTWLNTIWNDSWPTRFVISDLQSKKLWEQIIRNDWNSILRKTLQELQGADSKRDWKALDLKGAAEQAAEAYSLFKQYRLKIDPQSMHLSEECIAFLRWKKLYEDRLADWGALDPADLPDAVCEGMKSATLPIPQHIILTGFEERTPQLNSWLAFLEQQGVSVEFKPELSADPPPPLEELVRNREVRVRHYEDPKQETIQCARWIRKYYTRGATFGIVVPELEKYRSHLARELAAELVPASVLPGSDHELPFNISIGTPLSREPMVRNALGILGTQVDSIPVAEFSSLIRSPFFNPGRKDFAEVRTLDSRLRENKVVRVSLKRIPTWLPENTSESLAGFLDTWRMLANRNDSLLPGRWAEIFNQTLDALGWPGVIKNMRPREFETHQAWNECLDALSSLDAVHPTINRERAVSALAHIAEDKLFQIKTAEQPIQVVGLLESAGMTFDHLWVMGCHADTLPAPPAPNPFLPVFLQKKARLPRCSALRELEFAERSLARLVCSSTNIIFSYPERNEVTELKVSPLLNSLHEDTESPPIDESHRLKDILKRSTRLEPWTDTHEVDLSEEERDRFQQQGMRAGYRVLKDQSDCPFRSFVAHRLHGQKLDLPEIDYDSAERGILVHNALEFFWKKTNNQRTLQKFYDQGLLEDIIHSCVEQAMKQLGEKWVSQPRFSFIERERTEKILLKWLLEELTRAEFKVIEKEKGDVIVIGGLKLLLRIDRIDQTENGETLLIDYKTGNVRVKDWFEERVQEPQLPLYACKLNPTGIAYAEIKKGELRWSSAYDPNLALLPKNRFKESGCSTWDELIARWRSRLTRLAEAFLAGRIEIDPFNGGKACAHCEMYTLCRIDEQTEGFRNQEEE